MNEGWRKYVHYGLKKATALSISGLVGIVTASTNNKLGNTINSFFDNKFFDDHFKINNKLNDKIYKWCSKHSKPIATIDSKFVISPKDLLKFLHKKSFSTRFTIIKKIYNENLKNFYYVAFTFDDEKILEINLIKIFNDDGVKLIELPQWKTIKPEEYVD